MSLYVIYSNMNVCEESLLRSRVDIVLPPCAAGGGASPPGAAVTSCRGGILHSVEDAESSQYHETDAYICTVVHSSVPPIARSSPGSESTSSGGILTEKYLDILYSVITCEHNVLKCVKIFRTCPTNVLLWTPPDRHLSVDAFARGFTASP